MDSFTVTTAVLTFIWICVCVTLTVSGFFQELGLKQEIGDLDLLCKCFGIVWLVEIWMSFYSERFHCVKIESLV